MASVKLILNRHRALKSGAYPLVFQLIHRRRKKLIYTSCKLFEEEFDAQKQTVRFVSESVRGLREVRRLNRELKRTSRDLTACISALEARGRDYDVSDIVTRDDIARNKLTLLQYMDLQIAGKHASKRFGTEAALRHTRASVAGFTGSRAVGIPEIDSRFVSGYEAFLRGRGVSPNTVCYYMRNLKTVYRQAKADGYCVCAADPFEHVRSKPRKTVKRALKREEIRRLYHADLTQYPHLEFARDIFMFSFFCRGMPFVDVIYLQKHSLCDGVLGYARHKTGQWLQVALIPRLQALIDKYACPSSPYVFAALCGDDEWQLRCQYRTVLERVNRNLKRLGRLCSISTPLTTYVARHTWATLAKELGTPASVISEGLGHTTEKTTRIYLKEFDRGVVDRANELVSDL